MGFVRGFDWDEGEDKSAAMVYLTSLFRIRLLDGALRPMANATCRVVGDEQGTYTADGRGIVEIPLRDRARRTLELEWGADPEDPFRNIFDADIRSGGDSDCAKRLSHLGFAGASLPEQVQAYQRRIGKDPTGSLSDIREALMRWHDGGDLAMPAGGGGDAASLVKRLYAAFNDSGVLGLGGTDEEGALGALRAARDQGIMKEVDSLYRKTYPDEPPLKEELDDELSGDEFESAMALYEEGMSGKPPASGGEKAVLHATLAPQPNLFEMCLLDRERRPIPDAECRLAGYPVTVYQCDGKALVKLPLPPGQETVDLEWRAPSEDGEDAGEFFEHFQTVSTRLEGDDDGSLENHLANLGFEGPGLEGKLEEYHKCYGSGEDPGFSGARESVTAWIAAQESPVPEADGGQALA